MHMHIEHKAVCLHACMHTQKSNCIQSRQTDNEHIKGRGRMRSKKNTQTHGRGCNIVWFWWMHNKASLPVPWCDVDFPMLVHIFFFNFLAFAKHLHTKKNVAMILSVSGLFYFFFCFAWHGNRIFPNNYHKIGISFNFSLCACMHAFVYAMHACRTVNRSFALDLHV